MSAGQAPRTREHFPRMKVRGGRRHAAAAVVARRRHARLDHVLQGAVDQLVALYARFVGIRVFDDAGALRSDYALARDGRGDAS